MRLAILVVLSSSLAACTETPSYFPPCVNPYTPCDAGVDASDGAPTDAPGEAAALNTADGGPADAPDEASVADAP